jgi:pyruvate ferredoxin oxidoreductase alpha subunit
LIEYYGDNKAETVVVAMGSVLGTIKEAVDELKKAGKKVGVVKITSLRPFPAAELLKLIGSKKNILVIDKSVSLGEEGILAGEIRRAFYGESRAKIIGAIMGLGGRDITKDMIKKTIEIAKKSKEKTLFVGK